jgi:hypothetical protein
MELLLIYQEKAHLIQFDYFSKSKCLNLQENDLIIILSNTAVTFLVTKMILNDCEAYMWKVPKNCVSWKFYLLTVFRIVSVIYIF